MDSGLSLLTGFLVAAAAALRLMPVSGDGADSRNSHPSLELLYAALLIPSPHTPGNKLGRKSLLSLTQLQDFSSSPSQVAVAH